MTTRTNPDSQVRFLADADSAINPVTRRGSAGVSFRGGKKEEEERRKRRRGYTRGFLHLA